jgi:hypothetical protein
MCRAIWRYSLKVKICFKSVGGWRANVMNKPLVPHYKQWLILRFPKWNEVESFFLQFGVLRVCSRNAICSETVGKCADYKYIYFTSFNLLIVFLMKSITVCIVMLMVCSSFLFFGLSLSHITLELWNYIFISLYISLSTFRNIPRI